MQIRFYVTLILYFLTFNVSWGQPIQSQAYIPKILQPSPEAAAFAKYGNYQVNMYSGLPSISIPLYEIKVGELKVPIALNYHASGNKVNDIASWVGLGWSLNVGGSITRKVMGRPDELQGCYLNPGVNTVRTNINSSSPTPSDLLYLNQVVEGIIDVEPDIYNYNFPGKAGRFLFNQANANSLIIMPYDPIAVNRTQTGLSTQVFNITDEGGLQYKFDTYEWTSTGTTNDAASTWMLTNMISANKQDTISFSYTTRNGSGSTDFTRNETFVINDQVIDPNQLSSYTADLGSYFSSIAYSTTTWQLINEIKFLNGRITIEQGNESREDLIPGTDAARRLKDIKIWSLDPLSKSYTIIRVIRLFHSYFVSSIDQSKKLRLDSISVMDPSEVNGQKYRFDYNIAQSLPVKGSKSVDYWGYYNGAANNSLIPRMEISVSGSAGSLTIGSTVANGRETNPIYLSGYILNKITYPTGGFTQFEYEANQYLEGQSNVKYAGGLRIKKISNYNEISATPQIKTYKYGENESGFGRPNFFLNNYFFQVSQTNKYFPTEASSYNPTKQVRSFYSNSSIDIEPYDGVPVGYELVTEYIGDLNSNIGKTIYRFNDRADGLTPVVNYARPIITSYHFNRGQLLQKIDYKYSNNNYSKVHTVANSYEAFTQQFISGLGLVVFKKQINEGASGDDASSFVSGNYSIRTGDNKLIQTSDTVYDVNDVNKYYSTTTKYQYNNLNHQQISEIKTTNSIGDTLLTRRKYPHDFITSPYTAMVNPRHIFNKVIEEERKNFNIPLTYQRNNYFDWSNNNYLPQSIMVQKGTSTPETRADFVKYDIRGNPLEFRKTNDITQAYIWDYQKLYPIAEVINSTEGQIAYTSFEADGSGNWTFSGEKLPDASAITGKKVYNLINGNLAKSSLTASTVYIISYWTRNVSPFSITGTISSPIQGRSLYGWTYFEHRVTGQTTINLSGSGVIDEVRLYPEKAVMTTMTYSPLIGMTSQSDANNRISYYEYDGLGRLIFVRDQDYNILRKICYNFQGQPENCVGN